jgi:histone H3/H4
MGDLLVVRSKVKELAKKSKCRCSDDAVAAMSSAVEDMVKRAAKRAQQNKRQTIRPQDI